MVLSLLLLMKVLCSQLCGNYSPSMEALYIYGKQEIHLTSSRHLQKMRVYSCAIGKDV